MNPAAEHIAMVPLQRIVARESMVARKFDCEFYRLRRIVDDYVLERAR